MLKEAPKSLPLNRRIAKTVNDSTPKNPASKLQLQNIVDYFFQSYQYFQKYRKISKSLTDIARKLKSIYTELDSLSQLKITQTTKTLLLDLQNRWENVKSQISTAIQIIENSDYSTLISQQFNRVQSIIDKVNQSPPATPILQKESTYMYGSLISQLNNIMLIINDSNDITNSKSLLQNFRNDLSHTYESFFKNSQISKIWKKSVIDECINSCDKIFYFLDFQAGMKIQFPIDPVLISNEFNQLLSSEFPNSPCKNSRAISVTSNAESLDSRYSQKKTITQIPKSLRSQSAQNDIKSKTYNKTSRKNLYSNSKKKNTENATNSENEMKNIIEDTRLLRNDDHESYSTSKNNSNNDNYDVKNLRTSSNSISSATPKCKKSRLPKRTTPDTPQTDVRPVIRGKAMTKTNSCGKPSNPFTPCRPNPNENQPIKQKESVTSPSQVTLLNSPQIHIKDDYSSSEAFPTKGIPFPKEEEIFSAFNDIVPLKESPKISFKSQGNNSPVLHTSNGNNHIIGIKKLSESINHYSLEDFISDSDSDEIIAAVKIENEKSPALGKLRHDLASITNSENHDLIDNEDLEQNLKTFIQKLDDHKSLIQANHLLDVLYQLTQKTIETIQSGQNKKASYQMSKIQTLLSLIEEEFIDNLSLDQIDYNLFEIGKEIKNLADSFFKADPTQPVMDQFDSIQKRLEKITEGNVNHYLLSEIQKLISMKPQIIEFVETSQQMKKSQSNERKKLLNEINSIQQRIVLLNNNKSNPVFPSEDIEHEISDLLEKQTSLLQKLSSLEECQA